MATTSNFGWETPDDTDYVKDGAAAIRTLGSAIDASMVDLKGGTTGQILSKASNTDLDFAWTAGMDSNTLIPKSIIDAAGDLIIGSAADTPARLAIGTNGQVLTSNGTSAAWASPSASTRTLIQTISANGASQVEFNPISQSYKHLYLVIDGVVQSAQTSMNIIIGSSAGFWTNNHYGFSYYYGGGNLTNSYNQYSFYLGNPSAGTAFYADLKFPWYSTNSLNRVAKGIWEYQGNGGADYSLWCSGFYTAMDRIRIYPASGTFTAGTISIYGSNE